MNKAYSALLGISLGMLLGGCAVTDIGGPTVSNYKPPVIDDSKFTEAQRVAYKGELAQCQELANKAITPFEESAALYSEAEMTRVTEKRRAVRRACLLGRGYAILY